MLAWQHSPSPPRLSPGRGIWVFAAESGREGGDVEDEFFVLQVLERKGGGCGEAQYFVFEMLGEG